MSDPSMIGDNSFFRNIPLALDLEQRLVWEGAGWAIRMIDLSYERLKAAAFQFDVASVCYPTHLAAEMFACCWSIVDQCHMLRKFLEPLPRRPDGPVTQFLQKFEAATSMRNVMDHLHSNIKNLAARKDARPPIFGAISFCVISDSDVAPIDHDGVPIVRGCNVVTLTAGALSHPKHRFQVASPAGRLMEIPVGGFQLIAFEHRLDISELIKDLRSLVAHFDNVVKPDQERQLREFARKNKLDEEKVVAESGASVCAVMRIEFPSAKQLEVVPESDASTKSS